MPGQRHDELDWLLVPQKRCTLATRDHQNHHTWTQKGDDLCGFPLLRQRVHICHRIVTETMPIQMRGDELGWCLFASEKVHISHRGSSQPPCPGWKDVTMLAGRGALWPARIVTATMPEQGKHDDLGGRSAQSQQGSSRPPCPAERA